MKFVRDAHGGGLDWHMALSNLYLIVHWAACRAPLAAIATAGRPRARKARELAMRRIGGRAPGGGFADFWKRPERGKRGWLINFDFVFLGVPGRRADIAASAARPGGPSEAPRMLPGGRGAYPPGQHIK